MLGSPLLEACEAERTKLEKELEPAFSKLPRSNLWSLLLPPNGRLGAALHILVRGQCEINGKGKGGESVDG